jgi:hypothetical protein
LGLAVDYYSDSRKDPSVDIAVVEVGLAELELALELDSDIFFEVVGVLQLQLKVWEA